MATLQDDGRIALAMAMAAQPVHLAWGRGLPAWDAVAEPEPSNATALVDEVGRRLATFVGYVEPNPAGEIELPSGSKYAVVAGPTRWLYVRVVFNFEDADGETIRELGITFGAAPVAGLPAGSAAPGLATVMWGSCRGSQPAQAGNQRSRWNTA